MQVLHEGENNGLSCFELDNRKNTILIAWNLLKEIKIMQIAVRNFVQFSSMSDHQSKQGTWARVTGTAG